MNACWVGAGSYRFDSIAPGPQTVLRVQSTKPLVRWK